MKNPKLIPLDLHMLCVAGTMVKGSASINAQNVASRMLKRIAMCCTRAKLQRVGGHQTKGEMEEMTEEIEIAEMTEVRLGVWRDKVIEVGKDVENLQNVIRKTRLLNLREKESKK